MCVCVCVYVCVCVCVWERERKGEKSTAQDVQNINLTQPSGISYFSLYTFFWSTCISIDPGLEFFVEVCLNLKLYIYIYLSLSTYI